MTPEQVVSEIEAMRADAVSSAGDDLIEVHASTLARWVAALRELIADQAAAVDVLHQLDATIYDDGVHVIGPECTLEFDGDPDVLRRLLGGETC